MLTQRLLLTLAVSSSFWSLSQGYQVNFQGQKQQGMGSVGTGMVLDGSAVFFNPGAITHLDKNSINLAVTPVKANILFEEEGSHAIGRTNSPISTPFSLYATYIPKKHRQMGFGLGIYTPFGSTISYENGWVGRFALTKLQLMSIYVQPTFSYKINEKLGIGGGFVLCYGKVNLQKDLPIQFADSTYASADLSGTSLGYGGNFGLYYKASDKWSFGLSYRMQVNMNLKQGDATFNVPTAVDDKFPDGKFVSSLPLPQVASFGAAYQPIEKLKVGFDFNFVGFKAYDTLAFDYEQNTASLEDTKLPRMYKNAYVFRLGGQYDISKMISVRAGASYSLSPVQNGYITPETPDNNRLSYTAGLSIRPHAQFHIDLSFLFAKVVRTGYNAETNLKGTFTTYAFAPGIGLIYNFKDEK
ncbi:MAG: long-chain fatty acid transporter [Bacteroidia bacterium]|nr:MAG: long-chain fatty acid transporter [Bacteroidia bacterium]